MLQVHGGTTLRRQWRERVQYSCWRARHHLQFEGVQRTVKKYRFVCFVLQLSLQAWEEPLKMATVSLRVGMCLWRKHLPKCVSGLSLMRSQHGTNMKICALWFCCQDLPANLGRDAWGRQMSSTTFWIFLVSLSTIPHLSTSFFLPEPNFLKALLLKAFRPWGCPAMPSTLAVRGPGFPEDAPRKAGRSCHRRFCMILCSVQIEPNWIRFLQLYWVILNKKLLAITRYCVPPLGGDCKVNYRAIGRGNGGVVKKRTPTFIKDVDPPTPSSVPTKYQTILRQVCFRSFALPSSTFVLTFLGWHSPAILPVFPISWCSWQGTETIANRKGFLATHLAFQHPEQSWPQAQDCTRLTSL